MTNLIPADFNPPLEARLDNYIVLPLSVRDAEPDCLAVNEAVDLIREMRGGNWPQGPMSVAEDEKDLREHERQFAAREAFAYVLWSADGTGQKYCGCLYIYPPHHPFDDTDHSGMPDDADAAVSFWITKAEYDTGSYREIYHLIEAWLGHDWPFKRPFIVNLKKP